MLLALAFAVFSFFLSCCGHAQQLVEPVTRKRVADAEDELEVLATSSSVKKLLRTHEGRRILGVSRKQRVYHCQYYVKPREKSFGKKRRLLNCFGAIDCTHIKITKPAKESSTGWFDREHNLSIILQVVVNHQMMFTDAFMGWAGSVNDVRVFRKLP